jgi:hypothetical protein
MVRRGEPEKGRPGGAVGRRAPPRPWTEVGLQRPAEISCSRCTLRDDSDADKGFRCGQGLRSPGTGLGRGGLEGAA